MTAEHDTSEPLTWVNVALSACLLLITVVISSVMRLKLETQIVVAGIRCVAQLTVLGLVLERVFSTESSYVSFAMTGVLGGLAALEVSKWRSQRRVKGMFIISLVPILGCSALVGLVGSRFVMNFDPPYMAAKFIPVMGMLLGNTMVGVALGLDSVLASIDQQRDVVECMLCYGATRWETAQPIVVDAVRKAMIPTITSLGITGLIAIPGMMTGQILGGADAIEASRYQQVIMYMISASVALGVVMASIAAAFVVIDSQPMLRPERVESTKRTKSAVNNGGNTLIGGGVRSRASIVKLKAWRGGSTGGGGGGQQACSASASSLAANLH